jgi:hypothetical protein
VKWYELFNIEIENHPTFGFGDEVGAVNSFIPEEADADFTDEQISAIKLATAEPKWRENIRAEMWVGKLVGQVLGIEGVEQRKLKVKQLIEMGVLKTVEGRNSKREPVLFVVAGEGPFRPAM